MPYGLQCPSLGGDNGGCWRQSGSFLASVQSLSTPVPWFWPSLQSLLVPLWRPMLALLGRWGADIKKGPGQCDAEHQNGVRELPGGKELGRSDPRSQDITSSLESSALERTLVNFCHADWQVFGNSLPGNRQICPEQNWKSWHFTCPAVSRWAKKSFRVNRRQWQLVILGPPSWRDSYQTGMYWEAPLLGLEGKTLMKENLLGANYSLSVFCLLGFLLFFI